MITFTKSYSFRHVLGQAVTPVASPTVILPAAPTPEKTSAASVSLMGYDVPVMALIVATAAVVGAIWVTSRSIQALDRA